MFTLNHLECNAQGNLTTIKEHSYKCMMTLVICETKSLCINVENMKLNLTMTKIK